MAYGLHVTDCRKLADRWSPRGMDVLTVGSTRMYRRRSVRPIDRTSKSRPSRRKVVWASALIGCVLAASVPAAAFVHELTSVPLGHGVATITWTGTSSTTVNSVLGQVGRFRVTASDEYPGWMSPPSSSGGTVSRPTPNPDGSIPIGVVNGTIGGTPFTLQMALVIPKSYPLHKTILVGKATGSFLGRPIRANLTANSNWPTAHFAGKIGSYNVAGTFGRIQRHGTRSTVHATYVVTR